MILDARRRSIAAVVLGAAGSILSVWGFIGGIDAALTGSGSGPGFFVALFFAGISCSVVAIVLAIVGIATRSYRALSWTAGALGVLPFVGIVAVAIAARA
jgi:hypothetical protein